MHVLSLPPAFVLSQDQTLMLRIQSRLNHVFLNRRELTPVSNQTFASQRLSGQLRVPSMHSIDERHRSQKNRVYSLVQNVTVEVSFQNRYLYQSREAPPPTFLFLLFFNCQTTDQKNPVKIPVPSSPGKNPNHQSASQPIKETPERKSSSPAAPPPSSVIGLIDWPA